MELNYTENIKDPINNIDNTTYNNDQDDYNINMLYFSISLCFLCCFLNYQKIKHIGNRGINILNNLYKDQTLLKETLYIENNEPHMCSICLEEYNSNTKICILSCGHIYHKKCILEWYNKDKSCPLCRINI